LTKLVRHIQRSNRANPKTLSRRQHGGSLNWAMRGRRCRTSTALRLGELLPSNTFTSKYKQHNINIGDGPAPMLRAMRAALTPRANRLEQFRMATWQQCGNHLWGGGGAKVAFDIHRFEGRSGRCRALGQLATDYLQLLIRWWTMIDGECVDWLQQTEAGAGFQNSWTGDDRRLPGRNNDATWRRLLQHNPLLADGAEVFCAMLAQPQKKRSGAIRQTAFVAGWGNFVAVSEGHAEGKWLSLITVSCWGCKIVEQDVIRRNSSTVRWKNGSRKFWVCVRQLTKDIV